MRSRASKRPLTRLTRIPPYMPSVERPHGSVARVPSQPVSVPRVSHPLDRPPQFDPRFQAASEVPPQSSFTLSTCARPFGQRLSTRGFGPHRDITSARPLAQRFPSLCYVPSLGFLGPSTVCSALSLAGLFHPAAASRVHSTFRGFDPSRSASRLVAGWLPPCRWLLDAHRPSRAEVHTQEPRLRGFIPREDAWLVPQGSAATRLAPLFGFSVSSRMFRAPSLRITPQLPLLTLPVDTYCLRTRIHRPTSASCQHSDRLGHL